MIATRARPRRQGQKAGNPKLGQSGTKEVLEAQKVAESYRKAFIVSRITHKSSKNWNV